jgi:hypothetical protein
VETGSAPAVPRQRWRLVLARTPEAAERGERDRADVWEAMLAESGLPAFSPPGRARPRVAFAAPLPDRFAAERELADIVLTQLESAWRVREALHDRMPAGWRLIDVYDVWLGAPALASQVIAADYRIDLGDVEPAPIEAAAAQMIAAGSLPRERLKGASLITYDLRPLLADVRVIDPGPPLAIRARTRFHRELGVGRPEEVVACLAAASGIDLVVGSIVRERLILADDLGETSG